jgi:hypothetical protein
LGLIIEVYSLTLGNGVDVATWVAWVAIFGSLGYAAFGFFPRAIEVDLGSPAVRIKVMPGDLLKMDGSLVIGVADTFDVDVPVIARGSLQGQVLQEIYGGDSKRMTSEIFGALSGKPVLGVVSKPGNTQKYGVGTIAAVPLGLRYLYFTAYSELDESNRASSSVDNIWSALGAVWEQAGRTGNLEPMCIPVLGQGLARLSGVMSVTDAIKLIVLSAVLESRKRPFASEIRVVVRRKEFWLLQRTMLSTYMQSFCRN